MLRKSKAGSLLSWRCRFQSRIFPFSAATALRCYSIHPQSKTKPEIPSKSAALFFGREDRRDQTGTNLGGWVILLPGCQACSSCKHGSPPSVCFDVEEAHGIQTIRFSFDRQTDTTTTTLLDSGLTPHHLGIHAMTAVMATGAGKRKIQRQYLGVFALTDRLLNHQLVQNQPEKITKPNLL